MDARIKSGHDKMMDNKAPPKVTYGVTPMEVMASMSGLDFVRGIFARTLPEPPIMEGVEPFDCSAEVGAVAIRLAVQTTLPAGTGYTTLEFKISFVRGMNKDTGKIRTEGKVLNAGRRVATAEARILDGTGRLLAHATTTCLVFEIPTGA
jgi:hypothetical protein